MCKSVAFKQWMVENPLPDRNTLPAPPVSSDIVVPFKEVFGETSEATNTQEDEAATVISSVEVDNLLENCLVRQDLWVELNIID